MSSIEMLKVNGVYSQKAIDALRGLCFGYDNDLEDREDSLRMEPGGAPVKFRGISEEGAARILHRLWFMGFRIEDGTV